MKRIVMTGGGTSGHVTPNIALIPELKKLDFEIHYIGTKSGIERGLIEREGIPYHVISAGKLRRYLDKENVYDAFRVMRGFTEAIGVIRKLKPDIVFSKGGFVSSPVVWAASINRIPAIIHESDYTPGLANKISMPFAKKICYTFPETKAYIPENKGVLAGIPVRKSLLEGDKNLGKSICGFIEEKPVVIVIGGSQGSKILNDAIRNNLVSILSRFQVCHICGKGGIDEDLEGTRGYKQFEYVNEELNHLFAMGDVVVSRAGATTIFELLALRKPNLLIPLSKKASRGDQILNANSFKKQGFSDVLMEEDLDDKSFLSSLYNAYENKSAMIKAMDKSDVGNGVNRVIGVIKNIMK